MSSRTARLFPLVALMIALPAPAALAGGPAYTVEFLGTGQGVAAMNESGVVVGNSTVTGGLRAWVASSGSPLALLPLPPGHVGSWATDINDAGVIVGAAGPFYSPEFSGQAIAWLPDGAGGYTAQLLGVLPGHVRSDARGLNNVGDIVGFSSNGSYRYPVRFRIGLPPIDLTATGLFDPTDVNDQRVVIDHSFTTKRLDLDTMIVDDLGVPVGQPSNYLATTGAAINDSNQVAGNAILTTSTSCDRQAALYTNGVGWQILSGCGPYNGAVDINDHGDVVMQLNIAPYVRFAGGGTYLLEDLIVDTGPGHWYLVNSFGQAINNARQIGAWGNNPTTGQSGAILLTPVATPLVGDIDGDGAVGVGDLVRVILDWGPCSPNPLSCASDLDGNGAVDVGDLVFVILHWG